MVCVSVALYDEALQIQKDLQVEGIEAVLVEDSRNGIAALLATIIAIFSAPISLEYAGSTGGPVQIRVPDEQAEAALALLDQRSS